MIPPIKISNSMAFFEYLYVFFFMHRVAWASKSIVSISLHIV
jgi:hypothetical protein